MLSRIELLQSLTMLMVDQGHALSDAQAQLSKLTTSELELHFARAINAGTLNSDGTLKKSATWADVQTAKEELQRSREQAEEARLEAKLRLDASAAAHQELLKLRELDQFEAQDKRTFLDAAKTLRMFGTQQSNFSLIRETLGPGFDVYGIKQAILANALQLAPAPQAELDRWAAEDIERHNETLLNANPLELRDRAKTEAAQRRIQAAQDFDTQQRDAETKTDQKIGFPELPRTNGDGTALDSAYLKKLSNTSTDKFRMLIRRYGPSQITARLREIR